MKKLFVVALAAIFVLGVMVAIAYASGYRTPVSPFENPHGGYDAVYPTVTNKCKFCHAVHLATGSYRILRANDAATACDYCHGDTGVVTTKYQIVLDTEGHGLGGATGTIYAPDDVTLGRFSVQDVDWGCPKCHSVHDRNTVILNAQSEYATSKLLKKNPNPNKATTAFYDPGNSATLSLSQWCTNCHEANYGIHTQAKTAPEGTVYGHDVSAAGMSTSADGWAVVAPGDGSDKGPKCRQCHEATGGSGPSPFPHRSGTTADMLKSGAQSTELDYVCASSCHNTASLP